MGRPAPLLFMDPSFILASQSPRRRELFALLGYPFEIVVPDVDEDVHLGADPAAYVLLTARQKAEAVAAALASDSPAGRRVIVAADTTVDLDGAIMAKPGDAAEAWAMLAALRGRTHQVHTGVCVADTTSGRRLAAVHSADVTMRNYSDEEIAAYIDTGDPFDKAGGYAIQHPTFRPAATLSGCYTAIMGLPLCGLVVMLRQLGIP
ncbi:MAG: Maf family protein, partial [Anaerolineae bacterium]|nr:Maf family protein [Anaerolineae bacterium]